jgi:hypothetical protein
VLYLVGFDADFGGVIDDSLDSDKDLHDCWRGRSVRELTRSSPPRKHSLSLARSALTVL